MLEAQPVAIIMWKSRAILEVSGDSVYISYMRIRELEGCLAYLIHLLWGLFHR